MIQKTLRLWEQEFNIVEQGIDREQVVRFIDNLSKKYRNLAEQQQHFLSLGAVSEKAAIEADKVARDIEERAKREAEAYAEYTVSRAREEAVEILTLGRKRAEEAKKQEVESILQKARGTAAITEKESVQQAQLFLIKSREAIESDLKEQVMEAYRHLLSSLQCVISQANDLQLDWKGRTVDFHIRENLEFEYKGISPAATPEPASTPETALRETETPLPVNKNEYKESPHLSGDIPCAESFTEEIENAIPGKIEAVIEKTDRNFSSQTALETINHSLEAVAVAEKPFREAIAVAEEPVQESAEAIEKDTYVTPELEILPLQPKTGLNYQGEVELIFAPSMEISAMSEIYNWLQTTPEVKILRTIGSWEKGTKIIVFLEKPFPLIDILSRIPMVEANTETLKKKGFLKRQINKSDDEDQEQGKSRISLKMRQA